MEKIKLGFLRGYSDKIKSLIKGLTEQLQSIGILEQVDSTMLEMLAENYRIYDEATALIKKDGLTLISDRGNVVAHPAVKIQKDAMKQITLLLVECGCTPKSRKKFLSIGEFEPNALDTFLADNDD